MAMAKKKFEVSLEEMNIELHRQVDVNSDNFKKHELSKSSKHTRLCSLFDNSNKYERNGNSEEGCHLADMSRSQRTNKSDDRSLFTSQVQSVAEERDLRDTLSERGFHSQTLRKVFFKAMLHSFVFL
jgi:hypothetical protein